MMMVVILAVLLAFSLLPLALVLRLSLHILKPYLELLLMIVVD